jgi:hypothetical protein
MAVLFDIDFLLDFLLITAPTAKLLFCKALNVFDNVAASNEGLSYSLRPSKVMSAGWLWWRRQSER